MHPGSTAAQQAACSKLPNLLLCTACHHDSTELVYTAAYGLGIPLLAAAHMCGGILPLGTSSNDRIDDNSMAARTAQGKQMFQEQRLALKPGCGVRTCLWGWDMAVVGGCA